VIFRGARVNSMKEHTDSAQAGEFYPAFDIRLFPERDQRDGARMKHKRNKELQPRYVINRCQVCGAVIVDSNRNRLTDRLCDGCMWNVERASVIYLLQLGKSQ
jgi:hypothetical protein